MKMLVSVACCLLFAAFPTRANLLFNPGFTEGTDGLDVWEGFDGTSGPVDPATFVTLAGPTAPYAAVMHSADNTTGGGQETSFYQTFFTGGNALPSGTYTWSATISNLTDPTATMFIKVWDIPLDWGSWKGALYQNVPLTEGTMTLTYTHDGTDLVQFGFSANNSTTSGFEINNPSLTVVPEPATLSLFALALSIASLARRRRT